MPNLRIILDGIHTGAFNMAADMVLLENCTKSDTVIVRLYGWQPYCISLGCMQDPEVVLDREAIKRDLIEYVLRPTGGRAVLHAQDCTYSCIFPKTVDTMGTTIQESYAIIATCLQYAFDMIGIQTESCDSDLDTQSARTENKLPCFLAPNRDELMIHGKKLVGSAQKRTSDAVLQHGSIPLDATFRTLPKYLSIPEAQRERQQRLLIEKCAALQEYVATASFESMSSCIAQGFIKTLGMPWKSGGFSFAEQEDIREKMTAH